MERPALLLSAGPAHYAQAYSPLVKGQKMTDATLKRIAARRNATPAQVRDSGRRWATMFSAYLTQLQCMMGCLTTHAGAHCVGFAARVHFDSEDHEVGAHEGEFRVAIPPTE
jgi:hypothetical protein